MRFGMIIWYLNWNILYFYVCIWYSWAPGPNCPGPNCPGPNLPKTPFEVLKKKNKNCSKYESGKQILINSNIKFTKHIKPFRWVTPGGVNVTYVSLCTEPRRTDSSVILRQHCRLSICSHFGWLWQIWDEHACLVFLGSILGVGWQGLWTHTMHWVKVETGESEKLIWMRVRHTTDRVNFAPFSWRKKMFCKCKKCKLKKGRQKYFCFVSKTNYMWYHFLLGPV